MRFILTLLASASLAGVAMASDGHSNNCNGSNSCPTTVNDNDTTNSTTNNTNVNTAVGGSGGKGGDADAFNINSNYAKGGDVKIERGAFDIDQDTRIDTHVKNEQSQAQSQTAKSSSKSGVYGSGNSSNYIDASTHNPREVASAAALYTQMAAGVCGKGMGASGQGLTFGGALNLTFSDNFCEKIKLVASFEAQGNKTMVRAVLCTIDYVQDADEFLHEQGERGYCDKLPTPVAELAPEYQPMQPVRD